MTTLLSSRDDLLAPSFDADLGSPYRARPPDGAPFAGAANQPLLRLTEYSWYDFSRDLSPEPARANPRDVSNIVFAQEDGTDLPNQIGASNLFWVWGQYLDHDLSLTEAHSGGVGQPIFTSPDDAHFMGAPIGFTRVEPLSGGSGPGDEALYPNEITSLLDASNVYGSSAAALARLRNDDGTVKLDDDGLIVFHGPDAPYAGDVRVGENIALKSMHALFAREHNRLVAEFAAADPSLTPDELFDRARAHVEAIQQAITYTEFLPMLLGEGAFATYEGYDPDVDPSVSVEFSTAVFRLGHTLLSPQIQRMTEQGGEAAAPLSLRDAFFQPQRLAETGVDPVFRGLAASHAQAMDAKVIEDVRSFLFGAPGQGGFDLVALNIQRGRDLGLPSYNDLRASFGFERAETFEDVTSDKDLEKALEAAYGDVDRIDAWVGGVSEDALSGGLVGELFSAVLIDQFTRVRDGDPYWSEARGFAPEAFASLWSTTLSDVIERNTGVEHMQDHALLHYARQGGGEGEDWLKGGYSRDLLIGFGGNDVLRGGDGDDQLEGGDGFDILLGDDGNDRLYGGAGDDRLEGGDGDDLLFGGDGDDDLIGGDGSNRLEGGEGADDFFVSKKDKGVSIITDFEVGVDQIVFVDEKTKKLEMVQVGDDVHFLLKKSTVVVENVSVADVRPVGLPEDAVSAARDLEGEEGVDVFSFSKKDAGVWTIFDFEVGVDRVEVVDEKAKKIDVMQVGDDVRLELKKLTVVVEDALAHDVWPLG